MRVTINDIRVDPELRDLLPPLTNEELQILEASVLKNGIQDGIKVWQDEENGKLILVDGHNRYNICTKHNIDLPYWHIQFLSNNLYPTKADLIKYMLETQLGRRNLSPIQRVAVTEKYRPVFEKKANENIKSGINQYSPSADLPNPKIDTRAELAKLADVGERTYGKAVVILNSDNEEVKRDVLAGKKSIDKGYREIGNKSSRKLNVVSKEDRNNPQNTGDCDILLEQLEKEHQRLNVELFLTA